MLPHFIMFIILLYVDHSYLLLQTDDEVQKWNDRQQDYSKCVSKLLDDREKVPDSAFTASSHFRHSNNKGGREIDFSPKAARESYDKENTEFAWCPKTKIKTALNEYLEIDLGRLIVASIVLTKGRFDQGAGKEFSPFYTIKYRRSVKKPWRLYQIINQKKGRIKLLKGPNDAFLDAFETLEPRIVARYIRIYPYSYTMRRVCMKLQIFGCDFENEVLEYRVLQGTEKRNLPITLPHLLRGAVTLFQDSGYDGVTDNGLLIDGIGRLTDSMIGANFSENSLLATRYVGWDNIKLASTKKDSITLWFNFVNTRNFSMVTINGYNQENTLLPHRIEAKFILNEIQYRKGDYLHKSKPDLHSSLLSSKTDPWVQFRLDHHVGSIVQLTLYFRSRWMLLSEVQFVSQKVNDEDIAKINNIDRNKSTKPDRTSKSNTSSMDGSSSASVDRNGNGNKGEMSRLDPVYVLAILLCLLVLVIAAISVFWLLVWHRRRDRRKQKQQLYGGVAPSAPLFNTFYTPATQQMSRKDSGFQQHHCEANGNIAAASANGHIDRNTMCMFASGAGGGSTLCLASKLTVGDVSNSSIGGGTGGVYASIHGGSDNDSGTEYGGGGSCTSQSHPYCQNPATQQQLPFQLVCSSASNGPSSVGHIFSNPLVDYCGAGPNGGIPSNAISIDQPDLVAMTTGTAAAGSHNSPYHQQHRIAPQQQYHPRFPMYNPTAVSSSGGTPLHQMTSPQRSLLNNQY